MSSGLIARSILKEYPSPRGVLTVLADLSLTVLPGESVAIMGPSGSGKSTLLSILGTLESATSGTVSLDGVLPFSLKESALAAFRNRQIGFVFQDHHLLPQCSALENVLIPTLASSGRSDRTDHRARAEALLDRVGLKDRMDHRPAELSGGERQRVALARALVNAPRLLLADEPTGNLDRVAREQVAGLLLAVPEDQDAMLVAVTHSESLARRFDRRFELIDGRLVSA